MSALQDNRDTREVVGSLVSLTVKAATTIYAGGLVAVDATGAAVPAANAANLKVVGRAEHKALAGEAVLVKRGVFLFENKAEDLVETADIGSYCYVTDDQTVQQTANSNVVVAGLVRGVTDEGVYVDTTMNPDGAVAGAAAGADAGETAGETAGAIAGAAAIAADLADEASTIKAAALAEAEAAIAADLADGSSTIKAAATTIAGLAIAGAGNVRLVTAPAAADSTGVKGDIAIDEGAVYLCTAANTWVKATLVFATWGA